MLPGAAFVEKDATYTNMTGHVQAAARVIQPPGDAGEDWQILMKLGVVFGVNLAYASGVAVREAIARDSRSVPGYAALPSLTFARPCPRGTGCRRRTRPSAGSGTSCSRTCRRSSSAKTSARCRARK